MGRISLGGAAEGGVSSRSSAGDGWASCMVPGRWQDGARTPGNSSISLTGGCWRASTMVPIGGQYVGTKWGISGPGIRHLFYFLLLLF